MQIIGYIGYIILGLFQLAAIMAGFEDWLGLHWIIAALLSLFITYIPLVGTVVGMFGAVTAWHWSWLQAGSLFFGPFVLILIIVIVSNALESRR